MATNTTLDTSPEAVAEAKSKMEKKEEDALNDLTPEQQEEVKIAERAKNCMKELDVVYEKWGFKAQVESRIMLVPVKKEPSGETPPSQ